MQVNVGNEVIVKKDKRFFRAKVTEIWDTKYTNQEGPGVVEIEYDNLFGTVRELIDPCYVYGVKSLDQKG